MILYTYIYYICTYESFSLFSLWSVFRLDLLVVHLCLHTCPTDLPALPAWLAVRPTRPEIDLRCMEFVAHSFICWISLDMNILYLYFYVYLLLSFLQAVDMRHGCI